MIDYVLDISKKYNYDLPQIPSYKFNERVKELGEKIKLNLKNRDSPEERKRPS
jgi:hypothetical protein